MQSVQGSDRDDGGVGAVHTGEVLNSSHAMPQQRGSGSAGREQQQVTVDLLADFFKKNNLCAFA